MTWRARLALGLILVGPLLAGCTSSDLQRSRRAYDRGRYGESHNFLKDALGDGRDQVLHLMEDGMALFAAGQYQAATRPWLRALERLDALQTSSLSKQAASLLSNDKLLPYKGEVSERVLLHTYLAMAYLLHKKYEDALVEMKRMQPVLDADPKEYRRHPFTRYLAGLCYEVLRDDQDAYIEYGKVAAAIPDASIAKRPLTYLAPTAEERARWLKLSGPDDDTRPPRELIVLVATGRSPRKFSREVFIPPSHRFAVPRYQKQPQQVAGLRIEGAPRGAQVFMLTDLAVTLARELEDRMAGEIARETTRKVLQETTAQVLRHNKQGWLSLLARVFFFVVSGADTRSWQSLPARLYMVRVPIGQEGGRYTLVGLDGGGGEMARETIEVPRGQDRWVFRQIIWQP